MHLFIQNEKLRFVLRVRLQCEQFCVVALEDLLDFQHLAVQF